jgi:hypothetical protein
MNKVYLLAAASLGMFAAPQAQAQLLGGGGLGGGLGGQLGGTLSGSATTLRSLPTETLRTTSSGSARGSAASTGSQRVDRRSGSVAIDRSLEGNLDAAGSQIVGTPGGSGSASGSGSGRAAGSGSASTQLVGADALRDVARDTAGQARDASAGTRDRMRGLAGGAPSLTGSASGSGNATGEGGGSIGSDMLAAAGSGAAAGDGAFAVAPGMPVLAPDGERFGKVRQIVTDSRGRVTSILVRAKDRDVSIPAGDLSASDSVLLMSGGATTAPSEEQPVED